MAYPVDSRARTGSTTVKMSEIRSIFFPSSGSAGVTGAAALPALSFSDLYGSGGNFYGKDHNWYVATLVGNTMWAGYRTNYAGTYSLSNWRNVTVRPWFTWNIGSWNVTSTDIGLPFTYSSNETIYGFSNYGYNSSSLAALSFGSITSPAEGMVVSNGGTFSARLRQAIFRTSNSSWYFRFSDLYTSTTPNVNMNVTDFYQLGSTYAASPSSTVNDSSGGEPTKIYIFGSQYPWSSFPPTSGSYSILVETAAPP